MAQLFAYQVGEAVTVNNSFIDGATGELHRRYVKGVVRSRRWVKGYGGVLIAEYVVYGDGPFGGVHWATENKVKAREARVSA
ncbi:hypothetical protein [Catellatospora sichuanensis]|uniref:hypothetical protein n=1 Tax=Catellatospora sichuanensis TaxID=1969805 RepID=UPI00118367A2|nr:hypothetical protein [Catellatospora sichuanensis]